MRIAVFLALAATSSIAAADKAPKPAKADKKPPAAAPAPAIGAVELSWTAGEKTGNYENQTYVGTINVPGPGAVMLRVTATLAVAPKANDCAMSMGFGVLDAPLGLARGSLTMSGLRESTTYVTLEAFQLVSAAGPLKLQLQAGSTTCKAFTIEFPRAFVTYTPKAL